MGSNACIGTGACFSSKKPTIIFIGDAALEEDYVLASLSWVSKKKLPILFVVDDNNYAVLTKKDERRDWEAKELAKAFKMQSFDMMDDPMKISKYLKKSLFIGIAIKKIITINNSKLSPLLLDFSFIIICYQEFFASKNEYDKFL